MTIKKKIEIDDSETEKKRESFISKGGFVASDRKPKGDFSNILIRIPQSVLEKVDMCVKRKPWMTRTQWIMEALDRKLDQEF